MAAGNDARWRGLLMPSLRTYDVFDTCITRLTGEPVSAFRLLGQGLVADGLWSGSAEQFAAARVEAETRARIHSSPREVRFGEIYEELKSAYALSAEVAERIAAAELALERGLLRPVPGIACEIDEARRQGHTVQFISDMYLPHDVLQSWLVDFGVMKADEVLWLSSEHGVTKGNGGLFELVGAAHSQGKSGWVHIGDNAHSDHAVPLSQGIGTRHFTNCHLDRNEMAMERLASETCGVSSLLAGAARWSRLSRPAGVDESLHSMATGIGGPVIYSFVLWVLLEARRRGLKKVWFMARDGQVMLPVARTIAHRLGWDFELGYLYGGRQVVRVASLVSIDEPALDWLTGGAGVMTLQAVLDRVGLSVASAQAVAVSMQLPIDASIGWDNVGRLRQFLKHPDIEPLVLAQARARRAVVLDYFKACGLIEGGSCAVVDIGWKGNVLRSIVDLIGLDEAARHTFMYFGSYAYAKSCEAVPRIAYLFDVREGRRLGTGDDIPSMTTLMEILCQADHGSVMQLERCGGGFEPVCRVADESTGASKWDVKQFQQGVLRFAETVPIERFPSAPVDLRSLCDRLLRRLATQPEPSEIELLASIGFVDDQGGSQPQPFAHAYEWAQVRLAYRSGQAAPPLGLNWWVAAAVSMTPRPVRWCMRAAARAGRMRARGRSVAVRSQRAAT